MRTLALNCMVLAFCVGCGSSSGPDGGLPRIGSTLMRLKITTAGNGLVRGAGADCRGSCTAPYVSGTQVQLVAVADPGSSFLAWAGACSGTGGCDLTLDADREVSATFAATTPPSQRRLTVNVQGKGRVTSSPAGLDCDSSTCTADFGAGTSVSLTATADSGFSFVGWATDCSGAAGCTLTLSKDATVSAKFVSQQPAQVHLSASTSGPGTITGGGLNCGESYSTCDVTVAGGSAVILTAEAPVGARFTGWGGACSGMSATCRLTLQSDVRVTAEFQSEVLVLVPDDGTNGGYIALNSTHLFWPRYVKGNFEIWSIPKNGGAAFRVKAGTEHEFVADDAYLYSTNGSDIYSTPVGGGEPALLVTRSLTKSSVGRLALDEMGALYWTGTPNEDPGGPGDTRVFRMQDRVVTVLAKDQHPAGAVAVDATHLYFATWDADDHVRAFIRRVPRGGGAVEPVLSLGARSYPMTLGVDPQYIYFRSWITNPRARLYDPDTCASTSGQVQVVSKVDFNIVRSLSAANGSFCGSPMGIEVNASVVYWNWAGTFPHGIFRANSDGSGFAAIESSDDILSGWAAIRVDDVAMYYPRKDGIIRRLK